MISKKHHHKFLLLTVLGLLFPLFYQAQNNFPWECGVDEITYQNSQLLPLDCSPTSNAFVSRYRPKESYIPDNDLIAIKYVHIAFHIWQDENGEGNWRDIPEHHARYDSIFQRINDFNLID